MDRRERYHDPEETLRAAFGGMQAGVWTALPGIIESYDPDAQTASVQPSIMGQLRSADQLGTLSNIKMPLCVDVPVQFPSGGGYTLTFPIEAGDECLIVFASRCIDAWWQNGGVQPQAELRMHDLSDGFAIIGFRSKPRALGGVSSSAMQLRSDDGGNYVEIGSGGVSLVGADGMSSSSASWMHSGDFHISADLYVDGEIHGSGGGITALHGDAVATGTGDVPIVFATVNSDVGSFTNANITVNAKGLITAASNGSAAGLVWSEAIGPTTMSPDHGYVANNASPVVLTLPSTMPQFSKISIVGKGAGGWQIAQNTGQTIHFDGNDTTTGVAGSLSSQKPFDCLELICITANTDFLVFTSMGHITGV